LTLRCKAAISTVLTAGRAQRWSPAHHLRQVHRRPRSGLVRTHWRSPRRRPGM